MWTQRAAGTAFGIAVAMSGFIMLSCAVGSGSDPAASGGAGASSAGGAASGGNSGGDSGGNSGGNSDACAKDADCDAESYCDVDDFGEGRCAADKKTGQSCDSSMPDGGDNQCRSNHCVDGLCCDTACEKTCEACRAFKSGGEDGICTAIPAGEDPDSECAADDTLCQAGGCSGEAGSCAPAAEGTTCRALNGGCDKGTEHCDGFTASCPSDSVIADGHVGLGCAPYLCDGKSQACPMSCTDKSDCTGGFTCSTGCKPWRTVVAGFAHTCALRVDGSVRCWGWNVVGQLGYGNTATTEYIGDDESPASAGNVNVGGTVVQIAAGMWHTCALLDSGKVRCWGLGNFGVLGYGNKNDIGDDEHPASAGDVDVGGTVVQITAGDMHTCALLDTGNVRCWGYHRPLGYGTTKIIGDNETPASAGDVNVGGTVIQIAAGNEHTCALLDSGSVRCWGDQSDLGALGHPNINGNIGTWDGVSIVSVGDVDVGGAVVQIAAGAHHTCALLKSGKVRCWGQGADGALGYGNTNNIGDDETPASAGDVDVGGTVVHVECGHITCALLDSGKVRCWGQGADGALGYGNTNNIGDDETPASAGDVDIGGGVVQLAVGYEHTCALLDSGAIRCWGAGQRGKLGYGNIDNIGDDEHPASAGDVPFE